MTRREMAEIKRRAVRHQAILDQQWAQLVDWFGESEDLRTFQTALFEARFDELHDDEVAAAALLATHSFGLLLQRVVARGGLS